MGSGGGRGALWLFLHEPSVSRVNTATFTQSILLALVSTVLSLLRSSIILLLYISILGRGEVV